MIFLLFNDGGHAFKKLKRSVPKLEPTADFNNTIYDWGRKPFVELKVSQFPCEFFKDEWEPVFERKWTGTNSGYYCDGEI